VSNQTIEKRIEKLENKSSLHEEIITHIFLASPNSDEKFFYSMHPDYPDEETLKNKIKETQNE
jgi:hypothetical protein